MLFVESRHPGPPPGWAGDDAESTEPPDPVVTAEIVRALAVGLQPGSQLETYLLESVPLLQSSGACPDATLSGVNTLEIASRLAALHALGLTDCGLETELVDRCDVASAWMETGQSDFEAAHANAMSLVAIATHPTAGPFTDPPFDLDLDGDGVRDEIDPDRDGDGLPQCTGPGCDLYPNDPTNQVSADFDGDGLNDAVDYDDDDDGVLDVDEIAAGTDPLAEDSDGDGLADGVDPCPTAAPAPQPGGITWGIDQDGDGVCAPLDACDQGPIVQIDPTDIADLDGDRECDGLDDDDDRDGAPDLAELLAGTDPRLASSTPAPLDPAGDADGDGLSNAEEEALGAGSFPGISPYLADSDSDGAIDLEEVRQGTDPGDPASRPPSAISVVSTIAPANDDTFPGPAYCSHLGDGAGATPCDTSQAAVTSLVTGGQPTPVARATGEIGVVSSGSGIDNLAGYVPQTLVRDLDGDGLFAVREHAQRTTDLDVDSDGDGFTDGFGDAVDYVAGGPGWDLQPDGKREGELDAGTDPADPADHVGKAGDVAPLGLPDGRITEADYLVIMRLAADPALLTPLATQNRDLTEAAGDVTGDQEIGPEDALSLINDEVAP